MTDEDLVQQYLAAGVCPWHPIYELPCPICYLRSFDNPETKARRQPRPGKGLEPAQATSSGGGAKGEGNA